ncbi:hypothetical protein Q5Y75_05830 [Ruegeria sp. 2205SS24-7]|uniref:hypothetical protein n=1 Tax=Ruegeria discodermiae TaxID=3064389 RepID=UPI002740F79F|nr:hypothetical protein [Ruegeria sp. 2205SS24-7]MDP5216731.1 hypothetical protein [Ruegeria sp. 2205SS24-7]
MSRITPQFPPAQKVRTMRGSTEEKRYYKWLHLNCVCCLSGRIDIELAHTGGPAEGKGMSRKAALWTVLPLSKPLHHAEERNRREFWKNVGIPYPQHIEWAERLYDHFTKQDDPTALLADMQARANRAFLAQILEAR